MPTSAEQAVKKLARLPSNTTCPNCGTSSKYGFSNICIKYLTFVCNACKSSHQAVSHRCKSLTMSSWDQGEVLQLKSHGNDYARKVWLATAPTVGVGGRPREGDDINVFKRFVVEVYERKRYYREPSAAGAGAGAGENRGGAEKVVSPPPPAAAAVSRSIPTASDRAPRNKHPQRAARPRSKPTPAAAVQAPAPPAEDLLDFGAFDLAPTPAPTSSSSFSAQTIATPTSAVVTSLAPDATFDPFNNSIRTSNNGKQTSIHAEPAIAPSPATTTANNHPFASSMNTNAVGVSNDVNNPPFDPFGGSGMIAPASSNMNTNNNGGIVAPPQNSVPIMKAPPAFMSNSGGTMMNNNGNMMANNSGMMNNNGNMMANNSGMMNNNGNMMANNSGMMNNNGNMMANNSGMMNNNGNMMANNSGMMNNGGGMMNNNGNMMMNGGMMANNNNNNHMMGNNNSMMMNGGMMNSSNNANMMNMNGGMMNMNGSMMSSTMSGGQQQQPAMNINVMAPMNNNISNNFDGTRAGSASTGGASNTKGMNKKPDPFAGLGF